MELISQKIKVIIPAYNEEDSIAKVINDIPTNVDEIIVVSNNSTDKTYENAARAGATVLKESRKGYGYACLHGMKYISNLEKNELPNICCGVIDPTSLNSCTLEPITKSILSPIIGETSSVNCSG